MYVHVHVTVHPAHVHASILSTQQGTCISTSVIHFALTMHYNALHIVPLSSEKDLLVAPPPSKRIRT